MQNWRSYQEKKGDNKPLNETTKQFGCCRYCCRDCCGPLILLLTIFVAWRAVYHDLFFTFLVLQSKPIGCRIWI